MKYFIKNKGPHCYLIIPLIILPLVYQDCLKLKAVVSKRKSIFNFQSNKLMKEVSLQLYFALWKLSSLIIAELIEDKLGCEKNNIKLTDHFFSDLGADSVDLTDLALYLEKSIFIYVHEAIQFDYITDLIDYLYLILLSRLKKFKLGWPKQDVDILINWEKI